MKQAMIMIGVVILSGCVSVAQNCAPSEPTKKNVDRTEKTGSRVVDRQELKSLGPDVEGYEIVSKVDQKVIESGPDRIERLPLYFTSRDGGKTIDKIVEVSDDEN